jgi:RNA polymerase sigma-70 factor, ECF subfamily
VRHTKQSSKDPKQKGIDVSDTYIEVRRLTDMQLVEATRRGDRAAFDELVRRHRPRCVEVAGFFLRNRSDSEDQVQIALIKAYEHLDQYQGIAEFSTWLIRIVTNQCLMSMRENRRARFLYLDEPSGDRTSFFQLSDTSNPEGDLAFRQLHQVIRKELNRLPGLFRHAVLLRDVQGLPVTDVAEKLGISPAAAKSRLARARLELRSRLTRRYSEFGDSLPLTKTAPFIHHGRRRAHAAA